MRELQQRDDEHYDSHKIPSPVTNDFTIHLLFTLMTMTLLFGYIIDVKGVFLHEQFQNGEEVYSDIPEGLREVCNPCK